MVAAEERRLQQKKEKTAPREESAPKSAEPAPSSAAN